MSTPAWMSQRSRGRRDRPRASWATILAWSWIGLVVLTTLLAPVIAPQGSDAQDILSALQKPSWNHALGTDSLGRGLLVRLIYGARPALIGAAIVVGITVLIGGTLGLLGGYLGGRSDRTLSVMSDVGQSVPGLLIGLVVFAIFPGDLYLVMAVTALFMCAPMYRIVRGATLTIRGELYVTAARAAGLSHARIIRRHLAPRLAGVIRVQASMMAALALVIEIGYGFLNLDVAPPAPSWGGVLADSAQYLSTDLWMIVPPIVVVALTILAFGILGEVTRSPAAARRSKRPRAPRAARTRDLTQQALVAPGPGDAVAAIPEPSDCHASAGPGGDPDTLLLVQDLSVATIGADPLTLVDRVSFDVRRGEVLGLVGETGAGKSVITRALVQLAGNTSTEGSIVFDGIDLVQADQRTLKQVRGRRIAYIGQDPMAALDQLFRIESQLVEAVRSHARVSRREARARALQLLKAVRVKSPEVVARQYPFEISGGQAQRVAIALALAGEPELLLADEPTTALDVTVQMEVLGLLKELQRSRGLTIILVTHDWGVVADMCDRVLTLYAGELVEAGDVRKVFSHPSHPYTAALREADPHLQPEGTALRFIPGQIPAPGQRPAGCRFADRCPMAIDECRVRHPQLVVVEDEDGHASRCIRTADLRERVAHA